MRRYRADLHIHSVLSPCGALEMSPSAIVERLQKLGVDWFAITDHNSMANCPAYAAIARKAGLHFTWGVEIQTMEEIHLLAYFDDADCAQEFDAQLYNSLMPINNDPEYFGDQVIIDENENILRVESRALINSSTWDLESAAEQVSVFGGLSVPAHVDATVNSVLSQLGFLPPYPDFEILGITAGLDLEQYVRDHPDLEHKAFLRASDAHYLDDLRHGSCIISCQEPSAQELLLAARKADGRFIDNSLQ